MEPLGTDPDDGSAPMTFSSQSDAESWLGESWRELADAGVEQVVLVEDGADRYEMSLAPE